MTDIAKSDLFFIITSISVVCLTVIIAILLIYIFTLVRKVKKIVDTVKTNGENAIGLIKSLFFGKKTKKK